MGVITYNVISPERYISKPKEVSHSNLKAVVPFLVGFVAGTGGLFTPQSAGAISRYIYTPAFHICPSARNEITQANADTRSSLEHLIIVREIFSLNMSEFAEILGVSRPTVYAWMGGQEPSKQDIIIKIRYLAEMAESLNNLSINRINKLIRRPIFGKLSFLDMLKTNDNIEEAIRAMKEIAIKESQARKKTKGSGNKRRSATDAAREYSGQIYDRV